MVKNKPDKEIYENQEEAFEKFRNYILPYLKKIPAIKEAVVWASLAEGKFGVYNKEFRGHIGSDVDLVLLLEEDVNIPKEFKDIKCHKSWFDGYINKKFRNFNYKGKDHKIDLLVVKRNELEKARSRLNGRAKPLYIKKGKKQELIK